MLPPPPPPPPPNANVGVAEPEEDGTTDEPPGAAVLPKLNGEGAGAAPAAAPLLPKEKDGIEGRDDAAGAAAPN